MLKHKHFANVNKRVKYNCVKWKCVNKYKFVNLQIQKHNEMKIQEGSGNTNEQLVVFRAHSLPGCWAAFLHADRRYCFYLTQINCSNAKHSLLNIG